MAKCDPFFEVEAELTMDDRAHIAFLNRVKRHIEGVTKDAAISEEMWTSLTNTIDMIDEDIHSRQCLRVSDNTEWQIKHITLED